MLKVESTVCFQRKRRRERAVTRERFSLFTVARGLGDSCLTTLRLLRVVLCCGCSDLALILFFVLMFVCSGDSLDYLVSAAALILFDQESPSPLTSLNNCVAFIAEILDFSCSVFVFDFGVF